MRSILFRKRDQLACWVASCRASGVDQQHESEQTGHLGVVGERSLQHPRQPDGLVR
jgi:hypothetical protein